MKVLLSGATAGTNFGDFLFAKMFQDYISNSVGKENVYWYQGGYHAMSDFYAQKLEYNRNYNIKDIDALVYISGGYFCGNDKKTIDYIIRFLNYFLIGIRCIFKNVPVAIIGVEAAQSKSKIIDKIQRFIFLHSSLIVVRNQQSMDYAKSVLGNDCKKLYCTADSVFSIDNSFFENTKIPKEIELCEGPLLFYHTKPYLRFCQAHFDKIIPILKKFLKEHPEYKVVVSADQYSDEFNSVATKVQCLLNSNNVIVYNYDNPIALCKVINKCDVVVTDKLHVGIVGAQLGKSVVSFSGHTQKIERLYQQLNIEERTVPLKNLTIEQGYTLLCKNHKKGVVVPNEIRQAACSNFRLLDDFLKSI